MELVATLIGVLGALAAGIVKSVLDSKSEFKSRHWILIKSTRKSFFAYNSAITKIILSSAETVGSEQGERLRRIRNQLLHDAASVELEELMSLAVKIRKKSMFDMINSFVLTSAIYHQSNNANARSKDSANSVSKVFLASKVKESTTVYVLLASSMVFHLVLAAFNGVDFSLPAIVFLCSVALLNYARTALLAARVKSGTFGLNSSECRELLRFIEEHTEKDDFFDGGKLKRILEDIDTSSDSMKAPALGGVHHV